MVNYQTFIPPRISSCLKSVDRALASLELLCSKGELGISQLARAQGITTSTAHRILSTFVAHGFAVKDQQSGKYVIGKKLCTLTAISLESISALKWSGPYLQELSRKSCETALFTVYSESDDNMVIVAQTPSPHPLHVRCHLLRRIPIHVTAFGNAYLINISKQMLDNVLKSYRFHKFTKFTVSTIDKLKERVAEFAKNGYASCRDDMFVGILSIAAPVMNCMKQTVGSLGVICPTIRVDQNKEKLIGKYVCASARKLSNDMIANGVI